MFYTASQGIILPKNVSKIPVYKQLHRTTVIYIYTLYYIKCAAHLAEHTYTGIGARIHLSFIYRRITRIISRV